MVKAHELKNGEDGIWCPRCGDVFHDTDVENEPKKFYTCPTCFTVGHEECRNLPEEGNPFWIEFGKRIQTMPFEKLSELQWLVLNMFMSRGHKFYGVEKETKT